MEGSSLEQPRGRHAELIVASCVRHQHLSSHLIFFSVLLLQQFRIIYRDTLKTDTRNLAWFIFDRFVLMLYP